MAAAHYDFSTSKSESYGYNNFMNAGFQLGIMLMGSRASVQIKI